MSRPNAYRLAPLEFHRRLVWFMGAWPRPEPDGRLHARARYEEDLNEQARLFGFESWVDAWHQFDPQESTTDTCLRIARRKR